MTAMKALVDAAYASAPDDRAWLERVLVAARPHLDRGLGVCGVFYDLSDPEAPSMHAPIFLGAPAGAAEAFAAMVANAPAGLFASLLRSIPSCATLSNRLTAIGKDIRHEPLAAEVLAPLGVKDFVSIAATEPAGTGCLVGAPLPEITRTASAAGEAWLTVAAHVTAGIRQRRAARSTAPAEGTPVWTGLVSGGWKVVETLDRADERFVVAKRDAVSAPPASLRAPLSPREREVLERAARGESNKRIALELGVAPSTVAGHLTNAATKLGVASRVELVAAFARTR